MSDALHPSHLLEIDPQTAALIAAEERRQREKIILIPSESLTPAPVREALGSVFTSIYAEGYPRRAMRKLSTERLADTDEQLASFRRYADWRFYKGTELADLIESLAVRRAAECFATADVPAERIFANVQPLSGAAANLAVYDAFVRPGETVMGMALTEGGHLTHGSEFNVTGKRYRIVSYAVNPSTGRLDYDAILRLAETHRPRMIIGGFTSYPWQPDWEKFREIADAVGAILLADVAHTAGMIIGGVYPNPVGHAHVVSFTTHKTVCGPRGAVILSTEPEIAATIDTAIFPGQQGGPHVNKFAAIAVALKLAQTTEFANLQRRIVENAARLAEALEKNDLTLAYGGTDTHLLLVDLRALPNTTGFVMMGEIAARILDLAGIVCNKNTLPGDTSAADAHGIRLGTPWPTQRGMGPEEMDAVARIIAEVLHAVRPFSYLGLTGELSRGKLPLSVLEQAKRDVRSVVQRVDPHVPPVQPRQMDDQHTSPLGAVRVRGRRARALLNEAVPSDLLAHPTGEPCHTYLFDENGTALCGVVVGQVGQEEFLVSAPRVHIRSVKAWLTGLAEGYVLFDPTDLFRKVQGPAVIEDVEDEDVPENARTWRSAPHEDDVAGQQIGEVLSRQPERFALHKPYFVGQPHLEPAADDAQRSTFSWTDPTNETLCKTPLHSAHEDLGAKLVSFAGWEMPVWYTSALNEHRAVRECAGLFDLGHMGVFQIEGEFATEFLNVVTSNYADWLEEGQSQYAYLFDPDGNLIDDVFIYCRGRDRYLMVVNAVNEQKDWEWLNGVNDGRYLIDHEISARRPGPRVHVRDLKTERGVIDVALQGPLSRRILEQVLGPQRRPALASLDRTEFCETDVDGHQMLIARTGYTGEPLGYEIYVDTPGALCLWEQLVDVGKPLGLLPCGLAARDSTRTEAGLPLYGHELGGVHNVSPFEAVFGSYVKLHKPFFIGRSHCVRHYTEQQRDIIRFEVESGARPVRSGAAVLDRNGIVLGRVTSCVSLGESQVGLALLERRGVGAGTAAFFLNPSREEHVEKPAKRLQAGDRVGVPVRGTVLSRFPERSAMPLYREE
jgi:glycine hydroxymethyltransferase